MVRNKGHILQWFYNVANRLNSENGSMVRNKGHILQTLQTVWILKTVGFQKQSLEVQMNTYFERPKVLRKNSKFANKS